MIGDKKTVVLFCFILLVAILLRSYRLATLTTFGGDQGQDFLVIRDMVLFHKWTLLGLKTSVYAFFQGPVYLYMLLPFFSLLKLRPISGAVAAIFYSSLTIILLFITVKKYFSNKVALISTALFAVSPTLIVYGNTPLYQHFLPLFVISSLYLFLIPKKNFWIGVGLGVTLGLGVETHLLNISLLSAVILFALIFERRQWQPILGQILGIITGISPTILFELRHDFLNTRYLLNFHPTGSGQISVASLLSSWVEGAGLFLGANSSLLGAGILVFVLLALIFINRKSLPACSRLSGLAFLLIPIILIFSLFFQAFKSFYILPFWLLLLILLPAVLEKIHPQKIGIFLAVGLILANLSVSVNQMGINHGYTMPEGWSLTKIESAAKIINQDSKSHPNFNVASLLDSPSRAYPVRYALLVSGVRPEPVENYPSNNYLYLIIRGQETEVEKTDIFEVASFVPYTIGRSWPLGDGIFLYRLDRNSWTDTID